MNNSAFNIQTRKGKIKFVNNKAKFGFITDEETKEEFYFKTTDLKTTEESLKDLLFYFEIDIRKRGPQAINIVPITEHR